MARPSDKKTPPTANDDRAAPKRRSPLTDFMDASEPLHRGSFAEMPQPDLAGTPLTGSIADWAEQIEQDLRQLKEITDCVRTYSMENGLDQVPAIAAKVGGLKVLQGIWLSSNRTKNYEQAGLAIRLTKQFPEIITAVIVGAVLAPFTAGGSAVVAAAIISSVLATAVSIGVKQAMKGSAYGRGDYTMALNLFSDAAAAGDAAAQYNLGFLHDTGRGVPADAATAREWYEKAAAQGYAAAEYKLGEMHEQGRGVPVDLARRDRRQLRDRTGEAWPLVRSEDLLERRGEPCAGR